MAARMLRTEKSIEAMKERHPMKEIGQPEDIANMALFLLSDKSRWISGQVMGVDGGMSTLKV
jgi:NAD(P)-dependent dehydrogenase (short-subunit alcohol dehydrogenase family)